MTLCLSIQRLATLAVIALLALLLAGCIFGDDDGAPTSTATPVGPPTAEATTTPGAPTPTSTASPDLPPGLEVTAAGTWIETELGPGDEVPDTLGAFLFDSAQGAGSLWSLAPGAVENPDFVFVSTTPSGNYVVAANHIVNTTTGQSFATTGRSGLSRIDDGGRALFQARGCEFWVVDLGGEQPLPVATFQLALGVNCSVEAWFSPHGSRLLVAEYGNNFDGGAMLYTVDLATAEVDEVGQVTPTFFRFFGTSSDGIALLSWGVQGHAWLGRFDWRDGTLTTALVETGTPRSAAGQDAPQPAGVTPSPDGQWLAWSEFPDVGVGFGAGGLSEWPVTAIARVDGDRPLVIAHRVALSNGIVEPRWLPDSSGIVVQSEDGFAILRTDGAWEPLAFPMAEHTDAIPLPAPDGSDRYAYDGRVVSQAGEVLGEVPAVADAWGRETVPDFGAWWVGTGYAWSTGGDRLILIRTEVPGGDFGRGGVARMGLPALITVGDRAPDTTIHLRVAADGDRLNARGAPGTDTERLGQFEDGTVVTISRDESIGHCGPDGCSILNDPGLAYGEGWWIYVSGAGTQGDLSGWVSSEFLDWLE